MVRDEAKSLVQYLINRAHTNTVGPLGKCILYLKMYSVADRDRSIAIELPD